MQSFTVAIFPVAYNATTTQIENAKLHLQEALRAEFGEDKVTFDGTLFTILLNADKFVAP